MEQVTEVEKRTSPVARPRSVAVISWILISGSLFILIMGILTGTVLTELPYYVDVNGRYLLTVLVGALWGLFLGWWMLKGSNWGRLFFCLSAPLLILGEIVVQGRVTYVHLAAVILSSACLYFLTRDGASAFFGGRLLGSRSS